ncbi:hypothetical protein PYCC9005_003924 [Savitreella phatthalungensis]
MPFTTQAELKFASRETRDGKKHWVEGGVSHPQKNFDEVCVTVPITDLSEGDFVPTLDENGFAVVDLASTEGAFVNEDAIAQGYYLEVENFFRSEAGGGASSVVIFDHTIRRSGAVRGPVQRVHVDQTPKAAYARVDRHAGAHAAELLKKRFAIVNLWRAIGHPAERDPLALCDYATVDSGAFGSEVGDVIATDRVDLGDTSKPPGETYAVAHAAKQRWYFYRALPLDKAILIKCFDSKDEVAKYAPHTAFDFAEAQADAPPRQSIEVRALLFWD